MEFHGAGHYPCPTPALSGRIENGFALALRSFAGGFVPQAGKVFVVTVAPVRRRWVQN